MASGVGIRGMMDPSGVILAVIMGLIALMKRLRLGVRDGGSPTIML